MRRIFARLCVFSLLLGAGAVPVKLLAGCECTETEPVCCDCRSTCVGGACSDSCGGCAQNLNGCPK